MQDEPVHRFWRAGDRQGYIDYCVAHLKTQRGASPTRATASRWFNLGTIITESAGDLWLHQDGEHLWWTVTRDGPAIISLGADPEQPEGQTGSVYFYRKPAAPWSNQDRKGRPLVWKSLHPKAPDFLVTEATLQQLGDTYAEYALALIDGRDLSYWHDLKIWKDQAGRRQHAEVFSAEKRTFAVLARRAWDTAVNANGQVVERRVKAKDFKFKDAYELEAYIAELFKGQEGLCNISGLKLQFDDGDDPQLCCSLDRIDSNGHYERQNLQVVCRFINRWKSDGDDGEFRRLLDVVRQSAQA